MHVKRFLVAAFLVGSFGLGACVSKKEFAAYKAHQDTIHARVDTNLAHIKVDGDNVDAWIAEVDPFLRWVFARSSVLDTSSDPPPLPPPPPPDGDWQ